MGFQVRSVRDELSKLFLLPESPLLARFTGDDQVPQHEGRQKEHVIVLRNEMVGT